MQRIYPNITKSFPPEKPQNFSFRFFVPLPFIYYC